MKDDDDDENSNNNYETYEHCELSNLRCICS